MSLREDQARFPFESAVAGPLAVLEILEGGLRGPDGVIGAERLEGLLRELQAVLDRLLGDVGLREVMNEVRIDAVEPAREAPLDQVRVSPVERAPPPPREGAVEHVAHDPAREGEPVAARLALLLEDSLADESLRGLVHVARAFRERLEVAELEAPAENRGDREELAQLLGQVLDAFLHGLLDRGGQRIGGDAGGLGEGPRARRDPLRSRPSRGATGAAPS